ncbi:sigma-54-dependent transcriptional regulator [Taibaiella koreensis]|uniref:sigma-54-dependent transcriptional regulator n=1 Tax=Taibaiella koreensis TaxID=1268548 RepID=UPI000E59FBC3|nr:sigma-54 dependent transcriptional regulator [Taibaiella koreensis]
METILLVDDDVTFTKIVEQFLKRNGYVIDTCHRVTEATVLLQTRSYALLLLDYRLPDGTGLDVMRIAQQQALRIPAIIMTSFNDVRTAVKAMQSGALDYITKPVNQDELLMLIRDAIQAQHHAQGTAAVQSSFVEGISQSTKKILQQISLIAPTDMSVIIYGESGTGKEYIARQIHEQSHRSGRPFIAVDCGTISPELAPSELFGHVKGAFTGALQNKTGKFEEANGGTLFLDEIGNLSYEVQVKLLRALQERTAYPVGGSKMIRFDIRIIVATNDDLKAKAGRGNFREDLYHRLNEFRIDVQPLRQRMEDLPLFVAHFIKQSNEALHRNVSQLSPEVVEIFEKYDWPGNIRELKNIVKRLVLLADGTIAGKADLPEDMLLDLEPSTTPFSPDLKLDQEQREKALIEKTLKEVNYNKLKAARLLNINRSTLYAKMEKYNIQGK